MTSTEIIQGTEYSCASDTNVLNAKKMALDFHTKNIGNPAKSTITPAQLKLMQIDYDTSKKKFDDSPCGKSNPETDACIELDARITSLQSSMTYFQKVKDFKGAETISNQLNDLRKKFDDGKCGDKLSVFRAKGVASVSDEFNQIDKARIEADSKYQAKEKIFFGAIVLFGAVIMLTMFGKNK